MCASGANARNAISLRWYREQHRRCSADPRTDSVTFQWSPRPVKSCRHPHEHWRFLVWRRFSRIRQSARKTAISYPGVAPKLPFKGSTRKDSEGRARLLHLLGDDLLQATILVLKGRQPLDFAELHAAVLRFPAVVRLLRDPLYVEIAEPMARSPSPRPALSFHGARWAGSRFVARRSWIRAGATEAMQKAPAARAHGSRPTPRPRKWIVGIPLS